MAGTVIIGSIGGGLSMYYIGAYIAIAQPAKHPTAKMGAGGRSASQYSLPVCIHQILNAISAVAMFYIWTCFYAPSWNGTPWVFGAEAFPQHVRTFTQACMAASNWLFACVLRIPVKNPRHELILITGSWWRASRRRCSPRWGTACTYSSRRS